MLDCTTRLRCSQIVQPGISIITSMHSMEFFHWGTEIVKSYRAKGHGGMMTDIGTLSSTWCFRLLTLCHGTLVFPALLTAWRYIVHSHVLTLLLGIPPHFRSGTNRARIGIFPFSKYHEELLSSCIQLRVRGRPGSLVAKA